MSAILIAKDVHKAFGLTTALAGASLSIAAGEMVALMGPSGSGKSTLLHCASGITPIDAGSIVYEGRDVTTMPDATRSQLRREEFGFVFQFGQLVPELTCVENVALALRMNGQRRKPAERSAAEALEQVGVSDIARHRPGEVSGGQQQRVAIARALVRRPRVIFADEPTGALDSLNGEQVMRLLAQAARDTNTGVVLVTHEARVAAYADREVVVRDGKTRSEELVA